MSLECTSVWSAKGGASQSDRERSRAVEVETSRRRKGAAEAAGWTGRGFTVLMKWEHGAHGARELMGLMGLMVLSSKLGEPIGDYGT